MIDKYVFDRLKKAGYNVVQVSEIGMASADDSEILEKATSDGMVLITLDEHFGDWAILPLKQHAGVIRIKVHPTTSKNILDILLPFLEKYRDQDFQNKLVIISKKGNRWIRTC